MGYCAKGEFEAYITRYNNDEIEIEIINSWELTREELTTCDNEDFFDTLNELNGEYNITSMTFSEG